MNTLTQFRENRSKVCFLLVSFVLITALVWGITGCKEETATPITVAQAPTISEPKVSASTPLKPGEEAGISVDVFSDTGVNLTYTWSADGGEIVRGQGSPAITYRAPDEPGTYNIRVVVKWDGQSADKATSIKIVEPTPTPTFIATDTPSPTSTKIPTPTPTVTLTLECESSRPPLEGMMNFAGEVAIKDPKDCTTGLPAQNRIIVSGTYEGIPDDVDIWVLIYAPNALYYPQSPSACQGTKMSWAGGKWQVPAYLGTKDGIPEWVDIIVVLTDQEASQLFIDWCLDGCSKNWQEHPGIAAYELKEMNITEKAYITVQTAD